MHGLELSLRDSGDGKGWYKTTGGKLSGNRRDPGWSLHRDASWSELLGRYGHLTWNIESGCGVVE